MFPLPAQKSFFVSYFPSRNKETPRLWVTNSPSLSAFVSRAADSVLGLGQNVINCATAFHKNAAAGFYSKGRIKAAARGRRRCGARTGKDVSTTNATHSRIRTAEERPCASLRSTTHMPCAKRSTRQGPHPTGHRP